MMKTYSTAQLAHARTLQDPLADAAAAACFNDKDAPQFREMLARLSTNNASLPEELPQPLAQFFVQTSSLPAWANADTLKRARRFFDRNALQIMSLLGSYALPYCYAAADGAQVLHLSERIRRDTQNRLLETALFVFDLFENEAFMPSGRALRSIQKVRLIHATIRYHILRHGTLWNEAWGQPINQEDMAGTNLAFSLIILRGLKKIGCTVSQAEAEAWLHAWRVVGYLMGVSEELLPESPREAAVLERLIRKRNFKPSEAGQVLTASLLHYYEQLPEVARFPKGYMPTYMRFVMGDVLCDMLNVPPANWSGIFVQQFRLLNLLDINPSKTPITRQTLLKQLAYTPTFAPPTRLG